MTDQELRAIEIRCLAAQPEDGTLSFNALLDSARDVPALVVEVRRLWARIEELGGKRADVPLTPSEQRARNYRDWGGDCPIAPDPWEDPVS